MTKTYDLSLTAQLTSHEKEVSKLDMLELVDKLEKAFLSIVVNEYALVPDAQISMSRSQDHG